MREPTMDGAVPRLLLLLILSQTVAGAVRGCACRLAQGLLALPVTSLILFQHFARLET